MTRSARGVALLTATLALATPAVVAAKTVHNHNITTPSKLIYCQDLKYEGPGINCLASYIPDTFPEGDPYIGLKTHGTSKIAGRSDSAGFPGKPYHLQYGDVWAVAGIRCHLKTSGLTCRNKDHHGFHLAKGDIRQF